MAEVQMPKADLDAVFVRNASCPVGKGKVDYYATEITGFLLEVRASGGKTYYLRYRDTRGRQCQYKIGDTKSISFDKARQAAMRIRSSVVLGGSPVEERALKKIIPTIAELFRNVYLPQLQQTRRNMGSDLSFWKTHLLPKFGKYHLDELTQQDIICAQQEMRAAGYAPGTANKWIVQLRYMYNVAKKRKVPGTEKNPAAEIKQFAVEGRERFLSADETELLRKAVERSENKQLKYIVALLLMTGCRKRELLDAQWNQFDLERRAWRIPLSKSGKARHVALSVAVVELLQGLPRWNGCPYVVPNPRTRKPFTDIHEAWATAVRRAGIPAIRIHDLRHSFAANLVNAGHSLYVVSKALGHSTTRMSERYAHLADETLMAAADAAAGAVGKNWLAPNASPA